MHCSPFDLKNEYFLRFMGDRQMEGGKGDELASMGLRKDKDLESGKRTQVARGADQATNGVR